MMNISKGATIIARTTSPLVGRQLRVQAPVQGQQERNIVSAIVNSSKNTIFVNSHSNQPTTTTTTTTTVRTYRGDAGDATKSGGLSEKEEELLNIAKPRADEIYQNHIKLPIEEGMVDADGNTSLENRKKRLIYRSKQRGWLEVDLLLGTWASQHVPNMTSIDELNQFEDFVNMETIDIYNVITLRLDVPEEMKRNGTGVVEQIQEWARSSPLGRADPAAYKAAKADNNLI